MHLYAAIRIALASRAQEMPLRTFGPASVTGASAQVPSLASVKVLSAGRKCRFLPSLGIVTAGTKEY